MYMPVSIATAVFFPSDDIAIAVGLPASVMLSTLPGPYPYGGKSRLKKMSLLVSAKASANIVPCDATVSRCAGTGSEIILM